MSIWITCLYRLLGCIPGRGVLIYINGRLVEFEGRDGVRLGGIEVVGLIDELDEEMGLGRPPGGREEWGFVREGSKLWD